MARRTGIRFKILERSKQVKRHIEHIYEQYQIIEALADKKSAYINDALPVMIQFLSEYEKTFDRFYEGL